MIEERHGKLLFKIIAIHYQSAGYDQRCGPRDYPREERESIRRVETAARAQTEDQKFLEILSDAIAGWE